MLVQGHSAEDKDCGVSEEQSIEEEQRTHDGGEDEDTVNTHKSENEEDEVYF